MQHKIFTAEILHKLAANGKATRDAQARGETEPDHFPVIKVFNPYGGATWLLTESEPGEPDILFGLCDLGQGFPELGYICRSEIEGLKIKVGRYELPLERDAWFKADKPLSAYAAEARDKERICA